MLYYGLSVDPPSPQGYTKIMEEERLKSFVAISLPHMSADDVAKVVKANLPELPEDIISNIITFRLKGGMIHSVGDDDKMRILINRVVHKKGTREPLTSNGLILQQLFYSMIAEYNRAYTIEEMKVNPYLARAIFAIFDRIERL